MWCETRRRFVGGSEATIDSVAVRDTWPRATDGVFGRGVSVVHSVKLSLPSTVTVRGSVIDRSHDVGLFVGAAEATIESTLVRDTAPRASDGALGDGVAVFNALSPASVVMNSSRIENSARAGSSNWGAFMSLHHVAVVCASFELEGEPLNGVAFTFEDLGGNGCGCPSPDGACKAESVGLEPPQQLDE